MYMSVYKYTYMEWGEERKVNEAKCKLLVNVDKEYMGYSCTCLAIAL